MRYAKQTCLSISNPSKYFRLRGKNLDTEEYAKCLRDYLSTSKSFGKLTIPDLRNVLGGLQEIITGSKISEQASTEDETELVDDLQAGEPVIVVWTEADDAGKKLPGN